MREAKRATLWGRPSFNTVACRIPGTANRFAVALHELHRRTPPPPPTTAVLSLQQVPGTIKMASNRRTVPFRWGL